jgi:hypothetical protein
MSEERQTEPDQDPGPIKHSDAERVTSKEAEQEPPAEDAKPREQQARQNS